MTPTIRPAGTRADVAEACALFREYADSLGVDLCFQGFDEELAGLPGSYAPPDGSMLLDTLPSMTVAQALYRRMGFRDVTPYRYNPIPGTSYMEQDLISA